MKLVIIESPYAGDVEANTQYARECMIDSLKRGEAPYASHLLYTQVLDDLDKEQRQHGMLAGFAWGKKADLVAVYVDLGITPGMKAGITRAEKNGIAIEHRTIYLKPTETTHEEITQDDDSAADVAADLV